MDHENCVLQANKQSRTSLIAKLKLRKYIWEERIQRITMLSSGEVVVSGDSSHINCNFHVRSDRLETGKQ